MHQAEQPFIQLGMGLMSRMNTAKMEWAPVFWLSCALFFEKFYFISIVYVRSMEVLMRGFLSIFIIFLSLGVYADDWLSPIDKKYSAKSPELFSEYKQAREILDSWNGQRERIEEASTLLGNIVRKDRAFAPAYREYGRMYMMAGYINYDNYEKKALDSAELAIMRSIDIEPGYADSYVLLGNLYTNMQRYNDAEKALVQAEKIGTGSPWLQLNWANLFMRQKQYEEALGRYQSILEAGTLDRVAYASALSKVTIIYWYMGRYDKVSEGYRNEIAYDPENAWIWGNYSNFLLFTYGDVDGAIESAQKAVSIMNYGMGNFTLACALYTKWAMLLQDADSKEVAQRYFDAAWTLYPYPERVIEKTGRYEYTNIAAIELSKWLAGQSNKSR